jgi:hypothetical protein
MHQTLATLTTIQSLPKRNLRPIARTASNSNLLHPRLRISTLQLPKSLHHPNGNIISFRQRILLSQTNSRPTAKRQIIPARSQRRVSPALRAEDVGVRAKSGGLAHHGVGVVDYTAAFGDEEGLETVFAAAMGEDGIFEG